MSEQDKKNTIPSILSELNYYRKAIVSAAVTFLISYLSLRSHGVTNDEWIQIICQTLAAGGLVWAVPNKKAE